MSGQHTQGRLLAATNYAQPELRDEAGNLVAVVAAYQPQDALRMAAAWNACDGITTGTLQTAPGYLAAIAGFHEQRGLAMEARAQRDALLDAMQAIKAAAGSPERVYQLATAALAKHQPTAGQQPA